MNLFTRKAASVAAFTVLGVTAGGIAWAQSGSAPSAGPAGANSPARSSATVTASDPTGLSDSDAAAAMRGHRLHGLGRHVLHGEIVLQTRKGFVTVDIARGIVSAVSGDSISVKSADGVTTTFAIGAKTKARSAGKMISISAVHVGDKVGVLGTKTGSGAPLARLIRERTGHDGGPDATTSNG
jgi:hypothetical protein